MIKKNGLKFLFTLCLVLIFSACKNFYKAGNLIYLGYPIETKLRLQVLRQYSDSLIQNQGHAVPAKWKNFEKLTDMDSMNNKIIYFDRNPEEMYLISFNGMLILGDVYNPAIRSGDWIGEDKYMPKVEEGRVKERLKREIIDVIERMAIRDGLPDSVLYFE